MNVSCPRCRNPIALEDINVARDIALCRACGETHSFADLSEQGEISSVDPSQPPPGAWYKYQGIDFEVGATTRSAAALFLVPFTLVWSGMSMGMIYGTQIVNGRFDPMASLFGIPFLFGTCVLLPACLMTLVGKLAVRGTGDEGSVFIGVGSLGWNRRFRWSEVRSIRATLSKWTRNRQHVPLLELQGPNPIRFGSGLSEQRRAFILAVLSQRVPRLGAPPIKRP